MAYEDVANLFDAVVVKTRSANDCAKEVIVPVASVVPNDDAKFVENVEFAAILVVFVVKD